MPPPKPISDSTDPLSSLTSPNGNTTTHKPILKHRSISELLTFDLPTSPKPTGPIHSDEDIDYILYSLSPLPEEQGGACKKRRPTILHTKSDTQIMHWGSGRGFRQHSPPRIDLPQSPPSPTGHVEPPPLDGVAESNASSDSNSALAHPPPNKKRHISFNTFVQQCISIEKPKKSTGVSRYDDDDDDDEDDEDVDVKGEGYGPQDITGRYPYGRNAWGYDG